MAAGTGRKGRSLMERLNGGAVLCAEGYLFELERRGYLQAGAFVPEVVLEHPEAVAALHREFLRAGSDVIEAFTYYGHLEKLRLLGKEDKLEALQRNALAIAKSVVAEAEGEPPLLAGNLCNTNVWDPGDPSTEPEVRAMFDEQVAWAAEAGVDMVIAETFSHYGEAQLALDSIKQAGLAAVVTLAWHREDKLRDGVALEDGARMLEQSGAEVVGLNCQRGPQTLMPGLERIRKAVSCHVAALPVPYRTTARHPTFQSLRDRACDLIPERRPFPTALEPFACNRYEVAAFAREAYEKNIRYIGLCCGGAPHYVRSMAEALGRHPPASDYSPDMSKHFIYGDPAVTWKYHRKYRRKL